MKRKITAFPTNPKIKHINLLLNKAQTAFFAALMLLLSLSQQAQAQAGAALNFDGTNDNVNIGSQSSLSATTAFTVETWLKRTAGSYIYPVFFSKSATDWTANSINFGAWSSGAGIYARVAGASDAYGYNSTDNLLPADTWRHVAVVYDGSGSNNAARLKIYINGSPISLTFVGTIPATSATISANATLGVVTGSSHYWKGGMDEVRVWSRALCQGEIQNNMNCELGGTQSFLQAYYKFNQGTGEGSNSSETTLTDASGNSNNGTLTNFALSGSTSNWVGTGGVTSGVSCATYLQPEINLKGNSSNITYASTTPATTNHTDFGAVVTGGSFARTFTIENTGSATLTISSITSSNSQFVVSNIPPSVSASGTATFTVTFNPTATGAQTATITVSNGDCDEASYTFVVTGTGTNVGAALNFDGSNDYVDCGNAASFNPNNIKTLETWVKFNSLVNDQDIVSKASTCSGTEMLLYGSNLAVYFMKDCSNFSHIDYPKSNFTVGQWYHLAVTWDGTKESIRLYVNGVSVGTLSHTGNINATSLSNPTNGLYLGDWGPRGRPLNGVLDEVRVWSITRTCDQISQLRNCELVGNESGLVAYYKFNQGVAASDNTTLTSLTDATANGNNGTFSGFALNGSTSNFITSSGVTTGVSCGAVVAPEVNLKGNTVSIASGTTATSTSNHTDFGNVAVNGSFARNFTIENAGTGILNVSSITYNNTKFVVSNAPPSVSASGSQTFTVTFNPTATGVETAIITVNNDDCDEGAYTFTVTGTGTAVLPIELLNFKATPSVSSVKLAWETANEVNNKGFYIEKQQGASEDWTVLAFVNAKGKDSSYDFVDNTPLSINYYRLRQIDNDGKETLSKVISASMIGKGGLKVYPNPVSTLLTLDAQEGDYQILNLLGQQVMSGHKPQMGSWTLDVSALPQGSYVIKVGAEQVKFVKQ